MKRASRRANFPAGLVQVDDRGVRDQVAQVVELALPVLGQLPRQGIGLRLRRRQLAEEAEHLTGLVDRDADDVDQEGQHDQNLDAVFTTPRDAGNAGVRCHP